MRAILIDPIARTITETDVSGYHQIKAAIQCDLIDAVALGKDVTGYVDDEGLFVALEDQGYFTLAHEVRPFAGRMLLLGGPDDEGRDTPLPAYVSVLTVKQIVHWSDKSDVWAKSEAGVYDGQIGVINADGSTTITDVIPVRIPSATYGEC
ncbi:protein of unknown function [Magnetospirillum sp. XM-1]|uniref:DUF3846 domain-containing protein n=1 Tax=Magnetospirillum sp. XM-1 TaxID=1663591 RepID=UPI00073DE94F|nr:hypothetical protein [Magnetospirillum sp. XM-1]CUW38805.1 protein of unknown function [Magnetospirillum sp. XM-1]